MKMFPVSLLPSTPAGKLQKTQELIQAGFIDKEQALSLLDFPDLDAVQSLATASLKLTEKQLYQISSEGKYTSPEPQQDLQLCISLAHQTYLKEKLDGLPEDRLELILRYIDDATRLVSQSQPAQAAQVPVEAELPPEMSTLETAPLEV